MLTSMTLARALLVLTDVAAARKRWGKNASSPYHADQIMEAIHLANEGGHFAQVVPPEEVTKLRRQLAACQNREKGRDKTANEQLKAIDNPNADWSK